MKYYIVRFKNTRGDEQTIRVHAPSKEWASRTIKRLMPEWRVLAVTLVEKPDRPADLEACMR